MQRCDKFVLNFKMYSFSLQIVISNKGLNNEVSNSENINTPVAPQSCWNQPREKKNKRSFSAFTEEIAELKKAKYTSDIEKNKAKLLVYKKKLEILNQLGESNKMSIN